MKVLFISRVSPPYYSGAGRAAFHIAKNLRHRGIDVTMLTARFDRQVAAYEVIDGVRVHRFMATPNYRLAQFLFNLQCAYWLLCNPTACDIIQFAYMPRYWYGVQIVARLLRKHVFLYMTLLGSDDLGTISRKPRTFLQMASYRRAQGILALTPQMVDVSTKYVGNPSVIRLLPYPVDTSVFYPPAGATAKAALRKKMGVGEDEAVAVFVGSVIERKGVDLLVEAWPAVMKVLPRARLYLVGPRIFNKEFGYSNADFTMRIDKRIEALGIGGSLVFTGDRKHGVSDYLRMADAFVLPSRNEGLANALLEAMSCGLPCIVCKQPWLPSNLIRHGESGLICEPTPEALANALIHILRNPAIAAKLGRAADAIVRQEYAPDVVSEKMIRIYRQAIAA